MDPNVTLARLCDLAAAVICGDATLSDVEELGAAFGDLDGWLTKGGFLPAAWDTAARRAAASACPARPHDDD